MSRVPYLLTGARWGYRMGDQPAVDAMYQDGFLCPLAEKVMGETAETPGRAVRDPARGAGRLRAAQPAARGAGRGRRALRRRDRAREGAGQGRRDRGRGTTSTRAPTPRSASLARLPPVFKEEGGTVTAGNSSGITDGAAAMVVLSAERAAALGVDAHGPRAWAWPRRASTRTSWASAWCPPCGGCSSGSRCALEDFDLVEVNEAFAAQVLACDRELHFDPERLNVNGGAIALGHPIGATGARIVGHAPARDGPAQGAPRPGHPLHQRRHGPGRGLRGRLMGPDTAQDDPHDVDVYAPPRDGGLHVHPASTTAQGIARLTLNRPPANVLSVEIMEEINARARVARVPARREAAWCWRRRASTSRPGFELPTTSATGPT